MYNLEYNNHYNRDLDYSPSLFKAPEITDTIKKNDELQTAEVEKGEIVAKPDLAALYKAQGKKHYAGGIPTYLEPNSFVFSNHNSMSFSKRDQERMEFKLGNKMNKSNNTPAEVLKRNIDIEHYNKLINNLEDPLSDDITKKSSILMLQKYQETLGKIAFLQESKKGFQEPLPEFAKDSAPVYDDQTKTNIKEQPQYMKYGGQLLPRMYKGGNPYKSSFLNDLASDSKCPCDGVYPDCIPCTEEQLRAILPKAIRATGENMKGMAPAGIVDGKTIIHSGTDASGDLMTNQKWLEYLAQETPIERVRRKAREAGRPGTDKFAFFDNRPLILQNPGKYSMNITPDVPTNVPQPGKPPELNSPYSEPYYPRVGMNVDQLFNMGYSMLNAASVERIDPMRSQIKSPLPESEYFNPTGALNASQGAANGAYNSSRFLNPYLASVANQETTGKLLDNQNGIISQYAERNVGVGNAQNQLVNKVQIDDLRANTGFDSKYYDETNTAKQEFSDFKTTARNETMGLYNKYRGENRKMQEFLASQPIAGSVEIRDKHGNVIGHQDQPLYGYDSWTGNVYKTRAGNILNARAIPQQAQYLRSYNALLQKIMESGDPRAWAVAFNSLDNFIASNKGTTLGTQE